MNAIYAEEKDALRELEERFAKLEEEYLTIMEEKRIQREQKEAEERLLAVRIGVVVVVVVVVVDDRGGKKEIQLAPGRSKLKGRPFYHV